MQRRTFLATGAAGLVVAAPATTPRVRQHPGDPLRLNFNENPLGLAPAARRAVIDGIPDGNRYPADPRRALEEAVAARHRVTTDHVVVGAGSTDLLRMAVAATAGPDAVFVTAQPTFEDIWRYGERVGVTTVAVPLRPSGAHDLDHMREVARRARGPVLAFICNPNNPTGTITPSAEVDAWISDAPDRVRFVVDEAYFEYVGAPEYHTALPHVTGRPNVIVVRTFSKIFGMAGMRVGYGIAHPDTAARLRRHQGRNNVSNVSAAAATASLQDPELIARARASNDAARAILTDALDEIDLEYLPSHTNFVMHRIRGDLERYIERMRERGALVGRPFPPMITWNRVSLSIPSEMEVFAAMLREFRERGWV